MTETDAEIIVRLLAEVRRLKVDRNAVLEAAAEVPYEWARKLGDVPQAGCVEEQIAKGILKLKDKL